MKIVAIAGMAPIARESAASHKLYKDLLGLPLQGQDEYISMEHYEGSRHFGVWPLWMAAQACFGSNEWPKHVPEPQATLEFEFADPEAVQEAVEEMKAKGQQFIHEARLEPWGQTVARFVSPEGLLIGFSYAPWQHTK